MKKLFLFVLIGVLFLSGCGKNLENKFNRLHTNLDKDTAFKIMGRPDDMEYFGEKNEFLFAYWFEGAKDCDDAQEKYSQGKYINYYCVTFYLQDGYTYYIVNQEDMVKGVWGVN